MTAVTHYDNASFLRELAERLPQVWPAATPDRVALLQRLANEELAQAEHDDWVRAQVAAARADTRPKLTTDQLRDRLRMRAQRLRNAL